MCNVVQTYLLYDYDLAANAADQCREKAALLPQWYGRLYFVWYDGLISLEMARRDKSNPKWMKRALECKSLIEISSEHCAANFENKLHLLLAELAFCEGASQKAVEHYDKAISLAESSENLWEEALACERAVIFCVETIDMGFAPGYYSRAYQLYQEWNGIAILTNLANTYGSQISLFEELMPRKRKT